MEIAFLPVLYGLFGSLQDNVDQTRSDALSVVHVFV